GVDAKAGQARNLEGEVDLEELFVIAALLVRHDVVDQRMDLLVLERRDIDAAHIAVDADHRRQAGGKVQGGGLVLDRKREQLGDIHVYSPNGAFARVAAVPLSIAWPIQAIARSGAGTSWRLAPVLR